MSTKPILFATDGSPIASEAMHEAIDLAQGLDVPVLVVTVWNIAFTPYGPVPPSIALDGIREDADKVLAEACTTIEAAGVEAEPVLCHGVPATEICAVARERDSQLIVMGSHGWGPVRRFLFGSVSLGVLHDAPCPVVIARASEEMLREAEKKEERELVAVE